MASLLVNSWVIDEELSDSDSAHITINTVGGMTWAGGAA